MEWSNGHRNPDAQPDSAAAVPVAMDRHVTLTVPTSALPTLLNALWRQSNSVWTTAAERQTTLELLETVRAAKEVMPEAS